MKEYGKEKRNKKKSRPTVYKDNNYPKQQQQQQQTNKRKNFHKLKVQRIFESRPIIFGVISEKTHLLRDSLKYRPNAVTPRV